MRELDLTLGEGHNHPDIDEDKTYMVKVYGRWHFGTFKLVWFGWTFWADGHCQYDKPGTNSSSWERIIEFDPETDLQK